MAFFDKLNQVAKNLGDKTSDVIETTRLNGKLASEKLAANEELLKIGQFYYDRYLMGQAEADIIGYCEAAKAHLDTADQIQADIDRLSAPSQNVQATYQQSSQPAYQAQPQGIFCTNCGASLPAGTRFCNSCGNRIEG